MGETERGAPTFVLTHLAGSAAGSSDLLRGGTSTLGNDDASALVTVATGGPDEGSSVGIAPESGMVWLDGVPLGGPRNWLPGSIVRIGNNAWTLTTPEPAPTPLVLEGPLHASRVPHALASAHPGRPPRLWLAIAAVGLALAIVVAPLWSLLFAAACVAMIATWWRRRRGAERALRDRDRDLAAARARLADDIDRRRHALTSAERTRTTPRRHAIVGVGDLRWMPEVTQSPHTGWDPTPLVDAVGDLPSVPIGVDLDAGPLAIVGDTSLAGSVVRSIVIDLLERGEVSAVTGPPTSPWRWLAAVDGFTTSPEHVARTELLVITDQLDGPSADAGPTLVVPTTQSPMDSTSIGFAGIASILDFGPDGLGVLSTGDGQEVATAICPAGRSEASVLGLPCLASDRLGGGADERGMLLFAAPALDNANELLASLIVDLARRAAANRLAVFVIDEVRRPLVRLRQIPHLRGYASLDDLDGVVAVLLAAAHHDGPEQIALAIADLPEVDLHLRRRGHREAAMLLVRLAAATDHRHLTVAGSTRIDVRPHATLCAAVGPRVEQLNGTARVTDGKGQRTIALSRPSARDLTSAVASLRQRAEIA